jgi:hypothetical protein
MIAASEAGTPGSAFASRVQIACATLSGLLDPKGCRPVSIWWRIRPKLKTSDLGLGW